MNILVVEDSSKLAELIAKGLEEEGYSVDIANDGETGLNMAQMNTYNLIVLDLMLPGMDGYEVIKHLRKGAYQTPIIILSAKEAIVDRIQGLDLGADDYLCKPFDFGELLARIRVLIRRGEKVGDIIQIADLELNPVTHEVFRAGQKIELSLKEFILLQYLMRNVGRVLTRTLIMQHVWDINFCTDTNNVDVYIRFLRNKIDSTFEQPLIHTVRGIGYVLKTES